MYFAGVKQAWKEALDSGMVRQYGCYEYYEESADVFVDEGVWQGWKMVIFLKLCTLHYEDTRKSSMSNGLFVCTSHRFLGLSV